MATADPSTLKVVKQFARPDILFCMARDAESGRIFFGSSDFKVYSVDLSVEKPEPQPIAEHQSYVTSLVLVGKTVISGSYDHQLIWTDADTHKPIRQIDAHPSRIRQIVATPDGKIIASVADDMVCRLWDVASGKLLHELRGHEAITPHHYPSMLYACAISADGKYVATGDKVGHVVVWEIASGKQVAALEAPGMYTWDPSQRRHSIGGIRSLAFSPDGKRLVVGGMSKVGNIDHPEAPARLEVFDWQQGQRTHEVVADGKLKGMIEHLAFHPSGDWFVGAGGGYGGMIVFYDPNNSKMLFQDAAPMHVHSIAPNEACDTIYAVGHNKIVTWELKAAEAKS
jgi:WD40 repeat protein